jgi:uncharacterized membrane protein YjjP (DUF1212 family)
MRIGYASLEITIGIGESGITRMRKVGPPGVNQRLDQQLWNLAQRVSRRELTTEQVRAELFRLPAATARHALWVTAVAVGLACGAFGRLLGLDWNGIGPVVVAATAGQYLRGQLMKRHVNVFFCAALVSFLSSVLGGAGAQWAGSQDANTAMIASILLLVPGVPAVNAQTDILEGRPTLGSARVVTVAMILVFMAVGLWMGRDLLNRVQ